VSSDFGRPGAFVPQKTRAIAKAKRVVAAGLAAVVLTGAALIARAVLR
jgi:hypothetical protein